VLRCEAGATQSALSMSDVLHAFELLTLCPYALHSLEPWVQAILGQAQVEQAVCLAKRVRALEDTVGAMHSQSACVLHSIKGNKLPPSA
jgi:hypothetical protein